jgi:GNAT superfamily N-acetyltransferase
MFTYSIFLRKDRERVIQVINSVAAEGRFLQTECYTPTLAWENLLEGAVDGKREGYLLVVVCDREEMIGFGRLSPDDLGGRCTGNVGIVLLPGYRYKKIGTQLLEFIVNIAPQFSYENLTADILFDNLVSLRLFLGRGFTRYSSKKIFLKHRNAVVEEIRVQYSLHKFQGKNDVDLSDN